MSLPEIDPGDTDYPTSYAGMIAAVDAHDHTSGNGVQIPTGGIEDAAISAAKLASSAVTTAKIAANAVTRAKLESVGQQAASLGSPVAISSASLVDVSGLSVSITTNGRPVMVGVSNSYLQVSGSDTVLSATIALIRGSTQLSEHSIPISSARDTTFPLSLWILDAPAAGTYTYKVQAARAVGSGGDLSVLTGMKITAYEL